MIAFAVGRLRLPLQEVYDMSWAEFVLRSIGLREEQEREEMLFREVAYQAYASNFIFSKKNPEKKENWWKIGKKETKVKEIPKAFMQARKRFLEEKNG